jgi:hypothetical protein
MIPGILLATRQTFYTILLIVLFLIIKFQNINNIYGLHFLLKLSYIYSFTPWLPDKQSGELGAQNDLFAVVGYLKMARTKTHHFPREFDIYPRVTLVGENYATIAASLSAWSPNKNHTFTCLTCALIFLGLKNEGISIFVPSGP